MNEKFYTIIKKISNEFGHLKTNEICTDIKVKAKINGIIYNTTQVASTDLSIIKCNSGYLYEKMNEFDILKQLNINPETLSKVIFLNLPYDSLDSLYSNLNSAKQYFKPGNVETCLAMNGICLKNVKYIDKEFAIFENGFYEYIIEEGYLFTNIKPKEVVNPVSVNNEGIINKKVYDFVDLGNLGKIEIVFR